MLNVEIVYANFLSNKIGPSVNLRRIDSNRNNFISQGINFKIISLDGAESSNKKESKIFGFTNLAKVMNRFFSALKLNRTLIGARILLYLKYERHSKTIIRKFTNKSSISDVLVFDEFFTCVEYLDFLKGASSKQKIILFHHGNGDFFKMFKIYFPGIVNSNYLSSLEKKLCEVLQKIDALIFVSDFGIYNFKQLNPSLNCYSYKFKRLYYGVEDSLENFSQENKIGLESRKINLVCVGSINVRKGQYLIVEAFKKLSLEQKEKLVVHFLGSGTDEMARLNTMVDKYGLNRYLIFYGGVEHPEQFLRDADAFILTSFDEGLPISIVEALSYSLPIFATRIAGIPETIYDNGLLINPEVTEVYDLLLKIEDLDLGFMGKQSKKLFESKFSYSNYIKSYSEILKSL
jgi:glycosyltransferase involved in cell wall biosynthesis